MSANDLPVTPFLLRIATEARAGDAPRPVNSGQPRPSLMTQSLFTEQAGDPSRDEATDR